MATTKPKAEPAAEETTAKKGTAARKPTAKAGTATTAARSEKSSATTKKATATGAKKATVAEDKPATAVKKSSTAGTAKKKSTAAAGTTGTRSAAKKSTATATKPAAKKSVEKGTEASTQATEAVKPSVSKSRAKPKTEGALPHNEGVLKEEVNVTDGAVSTLPLIDATALVSAPSREVGEAHPPIGFPESAVKRNFFARLGVLLLLVAVLAASVLIYIYRPTSYVERTDAVNFLYAAGENKTAVVVNGEVRGTLDGALQSALHSARGDVYAAVVGEVLYLIRGKSIIPVAENVLDYQLAAGGSAMAYRTAENCLYYRKTGKRDAASLISKGCMSAAYCLSTDGRELVYTYQREPDGVALLQIESFTDSKPYIESVAGLVPVAVSNKCEYIYFTDESGALFIYNRKTEKRVRCAAAPDAGSLTFNRDCTELLFTEGGATVLFIEGERRQIVGAAAQDSLVLLPNRRVAVLPCSNGVQYMAASFLNAYYLHLVGTGKQLAHLDRRAKLTDISFVDNQDTVTVTDKGVFFLLTDKSSTDTHTVLYRVKPRKTDKELVAWDVAGYQTNVDGSHVLYTGHQDALYAWSTSQNTKRICDSILPDSLTVTADDVFCFYRADGVLAVSDNGRAVRDIATGVQGFLVDTHTVFYITALPDAGGAAVYVNYRNARIGQSLGDGYTDFH